MTSRMTAKEFVGIEVRRAREAKGLSRAKLAKLAMVSDSLIAAWESGRQSIMTEHMKRLLGIDGDGTQGYPLLDFPPDVILRMVEELVDGEALPEWEGGWRMVEEAADGLHSFETTLVNGLLQCPEYAQAVLPSEESVKARHERQRRFMDGDGRPTLVALMAEAVLYNNVGGPAVMARQMEYLIECAERENILLHVIPASSGICAIFRTPFLIATLNGGKGVVYTDGAVKGEVIEQPDDVASLQWLFDQYRAVALRTDESISLIRQTAEQRWKL